MSNEEVFGMLYEAMFTTGSSNAAMAA